MSMVRINIIESHAATVVYIIFHKIKKNKAKYYIYIIVKTNTILYNWYLYYIMTKGFKWVCTGWQQSSGF